MRVFIGIDVAIAKSKRMPICAVTRTSSNIEPMQLRSRGRPMPPRGPGNFGIPQEDSAGLLAEQTASYLESLEHEYGFTIARIAIDAPRSPSPAGLTRRSSEKDLAEAGISCFTTPNADSVRDILQRALEYRDAGMPAASVPYANKLWMLAGFALFRRLEQRWPCIEVYPQATAHAIGAASVHKSSNDGLIRQLEAAAAYTGWPQNPDPSQLLRITWAPKADSLDAYLAAWVAALEPIECKTFGSTPDDMIWVPASRRTPLASECA